MEQYIVTGMSCAACQTRVEKAVSKVPGVKSCSVSLLTNSMGVEGTASAEDIIRAVEEAGYGASVKGTDAKKESRLAAEEDALKDRETPVLKRRLVTSVGFLVVLMYFTMGHNMWDWPIPSFFDQNKVASGLVQLLLATAVMIINGKFFTSGYKALLDRSPNMDTLVALGSSASYGWSVYVLFVMSQAAWEGDLETAHALYHDSLYFESAAMIPTLITIGKMLEARSKGKTTSALKGLMRLSPRTAVIRRNGMEQEVRIEDVRVNDAVVVKPGENIPVDGIVIEGAGAVNEAALTGESIPVDKKEGDRVYSATLNQSGYLVIQAEKVGEDTTLSKIIQMVSDAAATKAPIARIADRISAVFVPAVIGIAALTIAGWLIAGQTMGFAIARGISVLVISCPCALGLATPTAIMVGNGVGAKNGVLFKTSEALEQAGKTKIVCMDKTGTITSGKPEVTDILPAEGVSEEELLALAYSLEKKSEHPLALAIVGKAEEMGIQAVQTEQFEAAVGNGLSAVVGGEPAHGGKKDFIGRYAKIRKPEEEQAERLAEEGKTPLFFERGGKYLGLVAVADTIRKDSYEAVKELQKMGIRVVMLTGDNEKTARAIGKQAGVDRVIAGVLPDGKAKIVEQLQKKGPVAMVGDGINDSPALTQADTGIAVGNGTDIAIDAGDIVLVKNRMKDVPAAIRLSRATLKNIYENFFWAFIYNVVCIPLAAGLFAYQMNPMIGAAAMSLSSVTVVSNALRLNLFNMHDSSKDKPVKDPVSTEDLQDKENEEKEMKTVVLNVEGMMCGHCENHVKEALEKIDGVEKASADKDAKTATVTLSREVDPKEFEKAVADAGYQFKGVKE